MKIIEAMKKVKDLEAKAEDLRKKVGDHCADLSYETPIYGDRQRATVDGWVQAHHDLWKEILDLKLQVQRTNLATNVTIEIDGNQVTQCIAAWVHRRRTLAAAERSMWAKLTDRGLKEGAMQGSSPGATPQMVTIRRYFDPGLRDRMLEVYRSEPSLIDGTLEVVNAVTDLVD